MVIFTNTHLEAKKAIRVYGGRTLILVNNTNQSGTVFKNVQLGTYRKGATTAVFINPSGTKKEAGTFGVFFGEGAQDIKGSSFKGNTTRKKVRYFLCTVSEGGIVQKGNSLWKLNSEFGWLEDQMEDLDEKAM